MDEDVAQRDSWGNPQRLGDANIGARFMEELLELSDDASPIPLGAAVILMPPADDPDPEQAAANMRRAKELAAEGRTVVLWTVGKKPPYQTVSAAHALATINES